MIKKSQALFLGSGLLAVMISPLCVPAARAADRDLLDILLANGAINQQQYERLLAQEELTREDVEAVVVDVGAAGVSIAGEDFEMEIGTRLHTDFQHHDLDSRMGAEAVDGTHLRRARLEMGGTMYGNWGWALEADFAGNKVSLKDVKLGYEFENGMTLYGGHQKQPYSLALEMSSNEIAFTERSIDNALVSPFTDRAIGLRLENSGGNWFFAGGVFGDSVSAGAPGDEGWGSSARAVFAPLITEQAVLHLGLRAAYREPDDASGSVAIDDETTDWSDLSIVDTGDIENTDSVRLLGPEAAAAWGPFSFFGEYNRARIERSGAESLDFDSWHVAAAWSLTGESRASAYRIDAGEFKGLVPAREFDPDAGTFGAWELAARYAEVDLNDGLFTGGQEEAATAALNWYPNGNMRFMFDWTRILDTDESNQLRRFAPGTDIYHLRAQYNY